MNHPNDELLARKAKDLFIVATVQCSQGFTRLGNRVRFSQKLYLRDGAAAQRPLVAVAVNGLPKVVSADPLCNDPIIEVLEGPPAYRY
jgi:hypothetical protein